jgi:hypothetical protein
MSTVLQPAFTRLANVSLGREVSPQFRRLADINLRPDVKPSFIRLASLDPRISQVAYRVHQRPLYEQRPQPMRKQLVYGYSVPKRRVRTIKTIKITPQRQLDLTYVSPIDAYRAHVELEQLQPVSSIEQTTAQLLHQDISLIQLRGAAQPKTSQPISLRSLLAVEVGK